MCQKILFRLEHSSLKIKTLLYYSPISLVKSYTTLFILAFFNLFWGPTFLTLDDFLQSKYFKYIKHLFLIESTRHWHKNTSIFLAKCSFKWFDLPRPLFIFSFLNWKSISKQMKSFFQEFSSGYVNQTALNKIYNLEKVKS